METFIYTKNIVYLFHKKSEIKKIIKAENLLGFKVIRKSEIVIDNYHEMFRCRVTYKNEVLKSPLIDILENENSRTIRKYKR